MCMCLAIEIRESRFKGVVMGVYHSPSASDNEFIRFLMEIVDRLIVKGQCMLMGDFNTDLMADLFYAKKLRTEMVSLDMK